MPCFEAYGTSGQIIASDSYRGLMMAAKGNPVRTSGSISEYHYYGGSAGQVPVVAIRCTDASVFMSGLRYTDHWIIQIFGGTFSNVAAGNPLTMVTLYVYDVLISSDSTYGMQAMDESGRITFDALKKNLRRVQSIVSYDGSNNLGVIPGATTQPSNKLYAWIAGLPSFSETYTEEGTDFQNNKQYRWRRSCGGIYINSSGQFVVQNWTVINDIITITPGSNLHRPGVFSIVDVTNH